MDQNFTYYIGLLLAIIIGLFIIKKVASCIIRIVVTVILVALLGFAYYLMQ